MKLKLRLLSYLVMFLLITGCAQKIPVSPDLQFIEPPEKIKSDYAGVKINLVNNNSNNQQNYFADFTIHTLEGNMHEWTNQAIEVATKEIRQRGGEVKADAERSIRLSFDGNGFILGSFAGTCKGTLKVETSSGYKKQYHLENRSPGSVNRACGGAITLGVIEFLNDKNIVDFMTNNNN